MGTVFDSNGEREERSMTKFLVTYHGGRGMPTDPEQVQQMLAAFEGWATSVGPALTDPDAPLGAAATVSSGGVREGQQGAAIGGYSIIEADSLDDVVGMLENHPFLNGGGSLQASESIAVEM